MIVTNHKTKSVANLYFINTAHYTLQVYNIYDDEN